MDNLAGMKQRTWIIWQGCITARRHYDRDVAEDMEFIRDVAEDMEFIRDVAVDMDNLTRM